MTFPIQARILLSFAYVSSWAKEGTDYLRHTDLLVDSGAFTAFMKGTTIDIRKYTEWLADNARNINHAAALDVIGDWRASAKNFDAMREVLGSRVKVVPAWHLGSPAVELERPCKENDYVAIGGCVPYSKTPKILMRHLIAAHRVAAGQGTKLHGLGITGVTTMRKLPWYSVDSSSWMAGMRFGQIELATRAGEMKPVKFGAPVTPEQIKLVRYYDGDPARVGAKDFNLVRLAGKEQGNMDRRWVAVAAARSFMYLEECIRNAHRREFHLHLATQNTAYTLDALNAHSMGSPYPSLEKK